MVVDGAHGVMGRRRARKLHFPAPHMRCSTPVYKDAIEKRKLLLMNSLLYLNTLYLKKTDPHTFLARLYFFPKFEFLMTGHL